MPRFLILTLLLTTFATGQVFAKACLISCSTAPVEKSIEIEDHGCHKVESSSKETPERSKCEDSLCSLQFVGNDLPALEAPLTVAVHTPRFILLSMNQSQQRYHAQDVITIYEKVPIYLRTLQLLI